MNWEDTIKKTTFEGEDILVKLRVEVIKAIEESRRRELKEQVSMLQEIHKTINGYIDGSLESLSREWEK